MELRWILSDWKQGSFWRLILFCFGVFGEFSNNVIAADDVLPLTKIIPDLRTIELQWQSPSDNTSLHLQNSSFLVKYCDDSPWEDSPTSCKSFITNQTSAVIRDLRPSSKYLVAVEALPPRAGRIILPEFYGNSQNEHRNENKLDSRLNREKATAVETSKYAIRNVECLKGQTNVTIETGEDFEGLISVQKPDGGPDLRCGVARGSGTTQRTYVLPINHTACSLDFSKNGTLLNAVLLIQEHAMLVLGSDRSFRISCDYQPAVIRLQTGIGSGTQVLEMERPENTRPNVPINFQLNTNVVMPTAPPRTTQPTPPPFPSRISFAETQKPTNLLPVIIKPTQQIPLNQLERETTATRKIKSEMSSRFSSLPLRFSSVTVSSALLGNNSEQVEFSRLMTQGANNSTAVDNYGNPSSLKMSMLQIIVVSVCSSVAVILLFCLLIWWILNRHKFTSCKRNAKPDKRALEAERYG